MLHLQARVHLQEVEGVAIDQELDGAGAAVVDRLSGAQGGRAEGVAQRRIEARRRRLLDHLLMASLRRTVALEEVHGVAVVVAEDLHPDMPRRSQAALQQDMLCAERRLRLAARLLPRSAAIALARHHPTALAASPSG